MTTEIAINNDVAMKVSKKEKKSKKSKTEECVAEKRVAEETPAVEEPAKKKKKKNKGEAEAVKEEVAVAEMEVDVAEPEKKKKKKKSKTEEEEAPKVEEKKEVSEEEPAAEASPVASSEEKEEKEEAAEEKMEEEALTVIVFGLPWEANEEQVKKDFEECGEVVSFRMPTDRDTGSHKGMCFVEYKEKKGTDAALAFNETDYGGRTLRVRIAEPDGGKGGKGKDGKGKGKGKDGKGKGKDGKGKGKGFSNGPSERPDHCKGVVVKQMSWDTTEDKLWELFPTASNVSLLKDKETGESRGMAFVDFADMTGVDEAIKKNNEEVDGRAIFVNYNVPKGDGEKGGKDSKGKGKKGKDGKGKGKGKKGKDGKDGPPASARGSIVEGQNKAKTFADSDSE